MTAFYFKIFYSIIFCLLISCKTKEIKEEFHQNGKLKIRFESLDGKKDGFLHEYDSNGTLRYIENWEKGVLNGTFKEFYSSGKILREGIIRDGITESSTVFYENENVYKYETFDSNGAILELEIFNEDGSRVTAPFPIAKIYDVKLGNNALLRCRMVNLSKPLDSLGIGQLIITSGLLENNSYKIAKDTIAMVKSENGRDFYYEFTPKVRGVNKLFGVLNYMKIEKDTTTIILNKIEEEFIVF